MINVPLTKFLFLDIETVGCDSNWENFKKNKKELSFQFEHIQDNLRKRFPEESETPIEQLFVNRIIVQHLRVFIRIILVHIDQHIFVGDRTIYYKIPIFIDNNIHCQGKSRLVLL